MYRIRCEFCAILFVRQSRQLYRIPHGIRLKLSFTETRNEFQKHSLLGKPLVSARNRQQTMKRANSLYAYRCLCMFRDVWNMFIRLVRTGMLI